MEELLTNKDIHTWSWEFHPSHRNKIWVDGPRHYCCDFYLPNVVCLAHKAYRVKRRINWKESQYLKLMTYISKEAVFLDLLLSYKVSTLNSSIFWLYHSTWSLYGKLKPRKLQLLSCKYLHIVSLPSWNTIFMKSGLHTQDSAWHIFWMIDSM